MVYLEGDEVIFKNTVLFIQVERNNSSKKEANWSRHKN